MKPNHQREIDAHLDRFRRCLTEFYQQAEDNVEPALLSLGGTDFTVEPILYMGAMPTRDGGERVLPIAVMTGAVRPESDLHYRAILDRALENEATVEPHVLMDTRDVGEGGTS